VPGRSKQPHAKACHNYAVRELGLRTSTRVGTNQLCQVAQSNRMRKHATAML